MAVFLISAPVSNRQHGVDSNHVYAYAVLDYEMAASRR
jgi:hypothetical protein